MAGTDIADNLLTSGQNAGVERAVLPMPQLSSVINARMRKTARWGKRYGHTALSTTNLGTGSGFPRCIGGSSNGGFAIVDDRCCTYNETAAAFVNPTAVSSAVFANPRIVGAVSGWLPDDSFFPVPARSLQRQKTTPCATCSGIGYLWTAIQYEDPSNATDQVIRVAATDPVDQTLVFMQDFSAAAATFGGITSPRLLVCGSTVVLTYLYWAAFGSHRLMARNLTSLAGGFSAEVQLTSGPQPSTYDATAYSTTQFVAAIARNGVAASVDIYSATTLVSAASQTLADIATSISVVGSATNAIYVGYGMAGPLTKVAVYTPALAGLTGTPTLVGAFSQRPLMCLKPAGGVRVVYGASINSTAVPSGRFSLRDVSIAATVSAQLQQTGLYPISVPFSTSSGAIYMWTKTEVGSQPGYATLITLPNPLSQAPDTFPLELSVQDYVVSLGQGASTVDLSGLSGVAQLATTAAAYCVAVPTLYTAPGSAVVSGHDFRILQTKHYTDAASHRSINALYADSGTFVPMGTLTSVDSRGAIEEGYLHAPVVTGAASGAAGSLTASSTYYYAAVYKTRRGNGRYEQSGVSPPVKVTLGAGQTAATVNIAGISVTARQNVQIEVYRTLANGQTFYLNQLLDSGIVSTYTDLLADTVQASQQALYTQVGQTLPNTFPPASRFGCVGGQRIFLGGLMRGDLVQASKLIVGDQSPTFCDSDAFRIVLPAPCTGIAWMDVLVLFTAEGIYVANGDGPTDDGNGDFGNLTRMPYELGCIEPRSVKVVDDGCFFQTQRGLYLLPRGFGAPVAAGDNVLVTLEQLPVITGTATVTLLREQCVYWSCVDSSGGTLGQRIVYDLVHKTWSVDSVPNVIGTASMGINGMGQWFGGEVALFGSTLTDGVQTTAAGTYADNAAAIKMTLLTGDIRPFGTISEGTISKVDMLAEVRSACTMSVTKTTEYGTFASSRTFALAAGDYQIGQLSVTETELGSAELREAMSLRVQYDESSTVEGLAFIALSVEHEQGQGLKRVSDLSRNT